MRARGGHHHFATVALAFTATESARVFRTRLTAM